MEIYVGNIPPNIKIEELSFLYQSFGTIVFIDIKNRCLPPFAFILFDNPVSAQNAAFTTNGYFYRGYQFQVKLLTPDDFSLSSSVISHNPENEQKPPAEVENPPEEKKPAPAIIRKLPKKRKMPAIPEDGKPGSLSDPLRKGLSGAGTKWYLRYLEQGLAQKEARIKAEEHKYLALGHNQQTARKKAEQHYAHLFRTLKVLK